MQIPPKEPDKLIRRRRVEEISTLSRSGIYHRMQKGEFPKPISLGKMSVAWVESEVQEWVNARITESRKPKGDL